ncbi:hypothetical protein [Oscillatoria acuminata]|uniref:hypothetical protein n=1 Tax=Oscillatoria acuminata TaxID=118323 RepID=UPI0002D9F9AB|nr:hypothetical protein [Oscillatoria acuminata]
MRGLVQDAIATPDPKLIASPEPNSEVIATPDPDPIPGLTGLQLAARLGVGGYNFTKWRKKGREYFSTRTQSLDPDGIAWTWEGDDDAIIPKYIPWGD